MFRKGSEFAASADPHLLQQYRHLHAKNTHSPQKKQGELPPRYPQEGQTEGREKGKEKGDIEEPFLAKREVEEYVELENKIKSNKDAFELWKSKIYEASSHLGRPTKPQNEKRREIDVGQLRMQRREEEIEQALQRSLNIISIETPPTTHTNHTQKIPRCQKQQILAQILRRRNNKFNKLGGTKILVKYDCEEEAKWMLEG